jgi:hypothetical protein
VTVRLKQDGKVLGESLLDRTLLRAMAVLEAPLDTLHAPPPRAGQRFAARYQVIPTLAGTLNAGASSIEVAGVEEHIPSPKWVVRR